ncbi:hypothetical protein [Actibacterium sp.]|uniref:hypothetical protein n=1 Tax=Actibacterium sp. TaxID=1872125 RepID=UPI003567A5AA
MSRSLISTVAAAAIAVAGFGATPAKADMSTEDMLLLLLGAATLYAVITTSNDNNNSQSSSDDDDYWYDKNGHRHSYDEDNDSKYPRYSSQKVLPVQCARRVRSGKHSGKDEQTIFVSKCLRESNFNGRLPRQCELTYRTDRGPLRDGYSAKCLLDRGFTIANNNPNSGGR